MFPIPIIENIAFLSTDNLAVDILRLDKIHPIISGNKWYKLSHYIVAARAQNASTIASFGGPYSNHIVALAFAAKMQGLQSIGYIRANKGEPITPTLKEAMELGMKLAFLGRTHFQKLKSEILSTASKDPNIFWVDEGGYGILGTKGIADLYTQLPLVNYDVILCAVGTGTTMAGLINGAGSHQKIIGVSILKNEGSIEEEIKTLLQNPSCQFELLTSFHQGGYAKTSPEQIAFMNFFWERTSIPTDIVYTGKLVFAVQELIVKNYFKNASKILLVHSGGLQGNRSSLGDKLAFK